ncbi:hypothetical protein BU15DRAFT_69059 [Melanogaster broomeanus]|nr:hypothetical protein BU15DRAFT_69059 [Melanogaster broomeanus]
MPKELPNLESKNVSKLFPVQRHSFFIVRSAVRFYIGEVLDIYKKGTNSRYGSLDSLESLSDLMFLSLRVYLPLSGECTSSDGAMYEADDSEDSLPTFTKFHHTYHLHTHAPISNILYHLGSRAFDGPNVRPSCFIGTKSMSHTYITAACQTEAPHATQTLAWMRHYSRHGFAPIAIGGPRRRIRTPGPCQHRPDNTITPPPETPACNSENPARMSPSSRAVRKLANAAPGPLPPRARARRKRSHTRDPKRLQHHLQPHNQFNGSFPPA